MLTADSLGRDLKAGYALRADTWGGDFPADGSKRIEYTLLRGNDYRFYAYSSTKGAKISFHIQDTAMASTWRRTAGKRKRANFPSPGRTSFPRPPALIIWS